MIGTRKTAEINSAARQDAVSHSTPGKPRSPANRRNQQPDPGQRTGRFRRSSDFCRADSGTGNRKDQRIWIPGGEKRLQKGQLVAGRPASHVKVVTDGTDGPALKMQGEFRQGELHFTRQIAESIGQVDPNIRGDCRASNASRPSESRRREALELNPREKSRRFQDETVNSLRCFADRC